MFIIDSHCHLNDETLCQKVDELLNEAHKNDVAIIICPSDTIKSSRLAIELANKHEEIYAAIGIHPSEVKNTTVDYLIELKKLFNESPKVVAVGEIGLDYHWDKDEEIKKKQRDAFINQIYLANELHLPIIVHSRDAIEDTLKILKEHKPICGGVMHCYSGPAELVDDFIKIGMYISFGGPVTFTNAKTPKEACLKTPLDKLLVETDSPYLSPHPFRGQENHPARVKLVLQSVANIKNISEEEASLVTSQNVAKLFHVKTNI